MTPGPWSCPPIFSTGSEQACGQGPLDSAHRGAPRARCSCAASLHQPQGRGCCVAFTSCAGLREAPRTPTPAHTQRAPTAGDAPPEFMGPQGKAMSLTNKTHCDGSGKRARSCPSSQGRQSRVVQGGAVLFQQWAAQPPPPAPSSPPPFSPPPPNPSSPGSPWRLPRQAGDPLTGSRWCPVESAHTTQHNGERDGRGCRSGYLAPSAWCPSSTTQCQGWNATSSV
nr:PREDICTED: uncharacterized protein LOC107077941 [Lepisosteus oculatus]